MSSSPTAGASSDRRRPRRTATPSKYVDPSDSEDIPFAPDLPPKRARVRSAGGKPGRKPKNAYLKEEAAVAVDAVLRASRLCQSVFNKLVKDETLTKEDKSPVTVADFGAQAIVNALLEKHFPEDPIVGEEDSRDLRADPAMRERVLQLVNSVQKDNESPEMSAEELCRSIDLGNFVGGPTGRFWTLDPIDGTKGFLRGEQYAVCLALVVDGQVELGVIGCPNLPVDWDYPKGDKGAIFVATRGQGAFQRSFTSDKLNKIKTTSSKAARNTVFCESVESGHSSQTEAAQIAELLEMTNESIRMDSQCKYGVVARGNAGIYLRIPVSDTYEEKIWDHAGGSLLVQEAGGIVTDVDGKPLDFSVGRTLKNNKGVVAAGSKLHAEVLSAVQKVLGRKNAIAPSSESAENGDVKQHEIASATEMEVPPVPVTLEVANVVDSNQVNGPSDVNGQAEEMKE
ncbi:hypothetical protein HDU83_003447 [Entophlyctis luteolus]|nr:hypothetical protein HDU83_003447 [Entophlyctis luteolus]